MGKSPNLSHLHFLFVEMVLGDTFQMYVVSSPTLPIYTPTFVCCPEDELRSLRRYTAGSKDDLRCSWPLWEKGCGFSVCIHRTPSSSRYLSDLSIPQTHRAPNCIFSANLTLRLCIALCGCASFKLVTIREGTYCFSPVGLLGALFQAIMVSCHENLKKRFLSEPAYSLLLLAAWSLPQPAG